MRQKLLLTAALLLIAWFVWRGFRSTNTTASSEAKAALAPRHPDAATAHVSVRDHAAPSVAAPAPILSPSEIARVVTENSVPGRMVFVDLVFSAGEITAVRATGAAGRAKPGAVQHGWGQLQYDVFSPTGERTLSGSVEDPLHVRLEYEDEQQPGKIRATVIDHNEGLLNLRLPGEADAARIVFYRETSATSREPAGEITLR